MRVIYGAILIVFAVAVGIFCVQNLQTVSMTYLNWKMSLPLPLLVVVVYLLGMVSGWGMIGFLRKSLRRATEARDSSS